MRLYWNSFYDLVATDNSIVNHVYFKTFEDYELLVGNKSRQTNFGLLQNKLNCHYFLLVSVVICRKKDLAQYYKRSELY